MGSYNSIYNGGRGSTLQLFFFCCFAHYKSQLFGTTPVILLPIISEGPPQIRKGVYCIHEYLPQSWFSGNLPYCKVENHVEGVHFPLDHDYEIMERHQCFH